MEGTAMNHRDRVESNNAEGLYTPDEYSRAATNALHNDLLETAHLTGRLWGLKVENDQGAGNVVASLMLEGKAHGWRIRDLADIAIAFGEGIRSVKDEIVFGE